MVKESKKKNIAAPDRDDLAQTIADSLNALFKSNGKQMAFFLDGSEETPMDLDEFISTGNTILDLAISNRPNGGIAVGRITELTGLEGSGKSLLGASLMRNTQQKGGIAVLIDTEIATNREFLQAQGVDLSKLFVVNTDTVEEIFDSIVHIIEKVRASSVEKKKLLTIVVDSVAAASTKREQAADFNKDGYATDKALIISKAMRKITVMLGRERIALVFTNQLRQKLNAQPFADQWTTSGGKAIGFHASTRIRLTHTGKIKDKAGNIVGASVKARLDKNRLGPPHREAEFEVYFNRGMDDYPSWLKVMKEYNIIKQKGAWYTYDDNGNEIQFQSKDFRKFIEEDQIRRDKIYQQICDSVIMKYQQADIDIDTLEVVAASEEE
jgi:recombination protein RecA